MNIILIDKSESQKIGGVVVFTKRLYDYLTRKGHTVHILRFTNQKPKEKYIIPIPYHYAEGRSFIFIPSEKTPSLIKKYLQKIHPDIVYTAIGLSPMDFLLPNICHELGLPIAGIWHGDFNWKEGSYQILSKSLFLAFLPLCRQLDLLHVFSEKMGKFYQDKGVKSDRILILPNGVDTAFYTPGPSEFAQKAKIGLGILFLGRVTLQKNPEVLIKSFLSLDPPKTTKLILVGQGELKTDLKQKYKDNRIIFTGLVSDEVKKRDIMRACRIFVLPSRFEGLSLALLEAMSIGLACITSDAGSNMETLNDSGIVIGGSHLSSHLPFALNLLLKNPDIIDIFAHKARQRAISHHSQDKIFAQLEKELEKTIQKFARSPHPKSQYMSIPDIPERIKKILQYI